MLNHCLTNITFGDKMELKAYIQQALYNLVNIEGAKVKGPVEFHLIVTPASYKDEWQLQVFGAAADKDQAVSTIKFTVNL